MARFFIYRPVFAWVIAILIMLVGALSMFRLPVAQYPDIAPPTVTVNATYPGASSDVVESAVIQPIEQSMTGLDGLLYMSSSSSSRGAGSVSLTFQSGTDPDIAQVQVQNKLQGAIPLLPQEVQQQGVRVNKSSSSFLMVVGFVSQDGSMREVDIADYVRGNIADPLSRLDGVGDIRVFGAEYAMRVWLDPERLSYHQLTPDEVIQAIREENAQVTLGELAGGPSLEGQEFTATIRGQGRMQTPEEFLGVILRADSEGSLVRLRDVAKVERGANSYETIARFNRMPSSGLAVSLAPGANALDTSTLVREFMQEQSPFLPHGMEVVFPFDTSPFVKVSIEGVVDTMIKAIIMVFIVMFLFLQNWRATIIPTIAIPVVLLGTLGTLMTLGYSINMLTMFAMVLAIGLLIDDAVVVVENVQRIMSEEGLSAREATVKSMRQITSALIGTSVVLSAVFIPMAFMDGAAGVIYRQFSATIVATIVISTLIAISLTPALCATLLKPIPKGGMAEKKGFFGWFNRSFDASSRRYQSSVMGVARRSKRSLAMYAAVLGILAYFFTSIPSSFLPDEDQGSLMAMVMAPSGATQERTMEAIYALEDHFLESESDNIRSIFTIQGFSFAGSGQNMGMSFIGLNDWDDRPDVSQSAQAIAGRAMGALSQIKEANVFAFAPPPMPQLGIATGVSFYLMDRSGLGHDAMGAAQGEFLQLANAHEKLQNVRPNGMAPAPQLEVSVDREKARALGLRMADINSTLSVAWAGRYVDDFIDNGRVKRVYVQGENRFRMTPEDFSVWKVRNAQGEMVPFTSFATTEWSVGSPQLRRYNGLPAIEMQGEAVSGVSTGEAMAIIESIVAEMPYGLSVEWTGMSYQERESGNQVVMLYALSLIVVFLCLAALYESWSVPTAVILVAPLGVLGTMLAAWSLGLSQDIYFQVAMLTTVGIASRNAIMMVEFAKRHVESGMSAMQAAGQAAIERIRPIIMTSVSFGLGVLPMAMATGAGSGAQNAIGLAVIGGMLSSTFLGVFFIPLFFVVVQAIFRRSGGVENESNQSGEVKHEG